MLLTLENIEVNIDIRTVIKKAFQTNAISVQKIIQICKEERGDESVLDELDNDHIMTYARKYDLNVSMNSYKQVRDAVDDFREDEKAMLLWHLLNSKEI